MRFRQRFYCFFLLVLLSTDAVLPQFFYFGRNKVQYEKFDWKVIRTTHFDIYYYNEMQQIAETGAYIAETAFDEYKVVFNHIVISRIPLIFYNTSNHFQQTNTTPGFIPEGVGGFFEFIKGRVVIPYTGSLNDFTHVIRHELVHVFMTTKISRILSDHRMTTGSLPPLWFVEGGAEFYSTKPDAQAEMVMRDALINNYFVGLEDMYQIYGSFLMYKEGQSFLEYVADVYGKERVMLLIDNFWMYSTFEELLEHTLGRSLKDIDSDWLFYLKRKYYPLVTDKAPPRFEAAKITDFGFNFSPVYTRVDTSEYYYFNANRDGYSSLYRLKIHTAEEEDPELVLRGEKTQEFEAFHLFQSGIDASPGGLIAFVTKSGATDAVHLFSTKEGSIIKTFQRKFLISISSPKFSHDGSRLIFNAVDQKGFSDLFIINIANDSLVRVTNDIYDDRDPIFGLTENQIIFSSDRTAGVYERKYNIFSYDLNTNEIKYLTYFDADTFSPALSPGKNYMVVASEIDGVRNLWQLSINNDEFSDRLQQMTFFMTNAFSPSFAGDSSIIFTGFENFSFNIYKYKLKDTISQSNYAVMEPEINRQPWNPSFLSSESKKEQIKYEKEFTLDYAQSQISVDPVYGARGGAILYVSDLLGDDIYSFLVYNTAETQSEFLRSFNVAIQRTNLSGRANYGYGIFNYSGRRYDLQDPDEYFFERSFGGYFLMYFPLSKFQRVEAGISMANSDKQVIEGVVERKALLVSNTLSWVIDNTMWASTGPVDGTRARLIFAYTGDVKYSNVNYFTVITDVRHYLRLGYRSALALRGALFYNEGKEARRYYAGGSWDIRGYPRFSIRGEKLWLSSLELRFPLIDEINLRFPFINLGFVGLRGALFADAGGAWDTKYQESIGSVGFGFRLNLFGVIVLRYDIGKIIQDNFYRFQPGLFYQFFFGWDF